MNRRDFIKLTVCSASMAAANAHFFLSCRKQKLTNQKPNVLFIAVDDMNDWPSILGGYKGKIQTPNLDRLAAKGVSFANAHCPSPLCNPSRTAIMTGLRPSTTGIYNNGQWWRPALPDVKTIPEYFRDNGYHVEGGGKLFHHTLGNNPPDVWDSYFPQVQDSYWHYNYPFPGQHVPRSEVNWPKGFPLNGIENVRNGKKPPGNYQEFDWGPFSKHDLEMGDGKMVKWAMNFLTKSHDKPFFLAAGIYRPHLPWYAPEKYFDMYPLDQIVLPDLKEDDLDDLPPSGRATALRQSEDFELIKEKGKYREAVQAYLASISFADVLIGLLLDAVEESPYAENTIIVLWSDHGWHLGEKEHWHKRTLWERATHVPFIISIPKNANAGKVCHRPVNLIDVYPTMIDLCNLKNILELDGISLNPLLKNPEADWERPALITLGKGNHAVRSERWRYIRYANGEAELYDLLNDPNEWTNLANEIQLQSIKDELARWLPKHNAPNALRKDAYIFNPKSYTWKLKERK